ncbi:MAG: hypothetical protein ACC707_16165, partial [Thiohalomonadales bacterium]
IQRIDMACLLAIVLITLVAVRFVWTDTLGAYSDDSVSYVIMAQAMSPYFDTSAVIVEAATLERYPPLFSLVLALSGVSHSYLASHIMVALTLGAVLVLFYLFSIQLLDNRLLAFMLTLLFALTPSVWLNLLGILSENLYLALSLYFLLVFVKNEPTDNKPLNHQLENAQYYLFSALLSLVMLSRTLGISLVAAYATHYIITHKHVRSLVNWRFLLPVLAPLLAAVSWSWLHDSTSQDLYATDVNSLFTRIFQSDAPLKYIADTIAPQVISINMTWATSFLLYWTDEFQATYIIVALFGVCVLAGIGLRLKENRLDAWYVVFYLSILIIWPYPDQFTRFIYAILPLLMVYGIYFIKWFVSRWAADRSVWGSAVALLFLFVSVAPASAFIFGRANYVTPYANMDFSYVTPFYNIPNIDTALRVAYRHEHLRQDLALIRTSTQESDIIMWYTPNYIRLISNRKAVRFPSRKSKREFLRGILESQAGYVFASALNPRYTAESFDGLQA